MAVKKYCILGLILFLAMLFFGCNVNTPISDIFNDLNEEALVESSELTDSAYVYNDPARGLAVYVDETGKEILIQAEEDSGTIVCSEIIDFIPLESAAVTSRHAFNKADRVKALVLGRRSDNFSGLWVIYSDGRVSPVINSEGFDTSELLEMVEGRQPLSGYFSWSYTALDMISNADASEIIITGYAENSGVERHNYIVEEGTTIGVYWAVTLDDEGYYHISRAKVIGYKDSSNWKNYSKNYRTSERSERPSFRRQHRWMWTLRMFFAGWYDKYLVMPEELELGENTGEYKIYGKDQEDEDAVAVVTVKKVLSIEPYEDPGPVNTPPVAAFYDFDYLVFGAGDEDANGEYVESGSHFYAPAYFNGTNYLFRFYSGGFTWGIDVSPSHLITDILYYMPEGVDYRPPESVWTPGAGSDPAPEVRAVSPISGYTEETGYTLRGNYIFSDIDGDSESGSIYKWYKYNNAEDEEGGEIVGENQNYITESDDEDSYLRFEITPVDDSGETNSAGTPLLSEAVFIGYQ